MPSFDVLLRAITVRQLGLVTPVQLLALGPTARQVQLRVTSGLLIVVHRAARAGTADPHQVPGHKKTVYVDLGYSPVKLALEGDSRRWHGARRDVQRNSTKANIIVAAGWRTLHFTHDDVRCCPDYLIDCVAQELHRRAS